MARPFLKVAPLLISGFTLTGLIVWGVSASGTPQQMGDSDLGRVVYDTRCAPCHGKEGKGNGPYATLLSPRPRDFTLGMFEYRTTESGSIPTDDDLKRTITKGTTGDSNARLGEVLAGGLARRCRMASKEILISL